MPSYSDYIRIQDYLPIYDITAVSSNNFWASFIPTSQFIDLLRSTLSATSSSDVNKRKSLWIQGTFGTGKSHASSVINHLFCDDYSNIEFYINKIEDANLREQLRNFRETKRFFPIVLKGVEGAYDLPRFSLSLQREVKEALSAAGHKNIVVKTDFETAIQYVKNHPNYTQDAIDKYDELKDIASTPEEVILRLQNNHITTYLELEEALFQTVGVTLTTQKISDWLEEMEKAIEDEGIANGLIIFWDEFTSIMDSIGSDRINVLQNIAEKSQSCNLFLFLISHRVMEQSQSYRHKDDISTMNDRFDIIRYTMDEVSTYRVMRHTFEPLNDTSYNMLKYNLTANLTNLIETLCQGNIEERDGISSLFPLHPYSAYLCSKLSDYVGSSNRSVVNFMHDDKKGFRKFISDENVFSNKELLTAEWLWDFFYDSFESDSHCGALISNYQNYLQKVKNAGERYVRVYKGILLLNTLATQFTTKRQEVITRISPNEKSIRGLFADELSEEQMNDILNFLDDNQIVSRDVFGDFRISVSSLNPIQVAKERDKVASQFVSANEILTYNKDAADSLLGLFAIGTHLLRKCEPKLFSCSEQEYSVRSKLNKYTSDKPNFLHVAIYIAITEEERKAFDQSVKAFSSEFHNSIHIIIDEVFSEELRTKFIGFIAERNVARNNHQESDVENYERAAKEIVKQWVNRLVNSTFSIYFNGELTRDGIVANVPTLINKKFSHRVFPKGMESIKEYRTVTTSFLSNKNFPKICLQMLESQNRDELTKFSGVDDPAKHIFEANENHLIDNECNLTAAAINGDTWIYQVCTEVDKCIEDAKKKYIDKFSLSEVFSPLMKPPYGFFPSRAYWVAFPYALRKHKADLFITSISQPISDEKLSEMIKDLFSMWNDGHSEANHKIMLRFGSKEESELTQTLFNIFQLDSIDGMPEIKSLTNARWGIAEFCKQKSQYPLWILTYCDNVSPTRAEIIKLMIEVLEADRNPDLADIKKLSQQINGEKVDIAQLVSNPNNYENGFFNFIKSMETVRIENDWWDELLEEISHLQSEVAFRKESEVRECVYAFYNKKRDALIPHASSDGGGSTDNAHATSNEDNTQTSRPPVSDVMVNRARGLVKNARMPNNLWQKVVLDIIEEKPELSEVVVRHLS